MALKTLCLASKSKGRIELLQNSKLRFEAIAADIDENINYMDAESLVMNLAELKVNAVVTKTKASVVIGADTVVSLKGKIYGKPKDKSEAITMLLELQGNTHHLITGLCMIDTTTGNLINTSLNTKVTFDTLTREEVKRYVDAFEPYPFAGAYEMNSISSWFISNIVGSPSNVVGLPMVVVKKMLDKLGHKWFDFLI
ncbi:MAG: Maf family protein [Candidatus Kariarchaeaceae archaeon]|jgi:septum formation protein